MHLGTYVIVPSFGGWILLVTYDTHLYLYVVLLITMSFLCSTTGEGFLKSAKLCKLDKLHMARNTDDDDDDDEFLFIVLHP